jgi:hypothetical protein
MALSSTFVSLVSVTTADDVWAAGVFVASTISGTFLCESIQQMV